MSNPSLVHNILSHEFLKVLHLKSTEKDAFAETWVRKGCSIFTQSSNLFGGALIT